MDEFLRIVAAFPTLLFTSALAVVVCFWLLVLTGAVDHDGFDGVLSTTVLVSVSLFAALGWFQSLTWSVLLPDVPRPFVLVASALGAGWLSRLIARPLATLFPDEPGPSRHDFIGLTCTIRTGRVDAGFGQAEVTARDGSTAVVQVRQSAEDGYALSSGSSALLYAYDSAGEFFWVAPS
ncbi:hypothetical protein ACIQ9E_09030 [Streptomyces sp. NPDC094448]|uniref:hypothetical protein n=1 Tax=Streptomyces sp. NPDC094448 TaxID=3366063 RepID=UPI0037F3F5BB